MSVGIWVDGRLVPPGVAALDPRDRGFTLGDGLFETIRLSRGRLVRLPRHLARLRAGATLLGLAVGLSDAELSVALLAAAEAAGLTDAAVRLTVSRGVPDERGLLPSPTARPTVVVEARPFAGYPPDLYRGGMRLVMSGVDVDERSPLAAVKSLSRLGHVLARRGADDAGADEALMRNRAGRLACASGANLFLVLDGTVLTPPVAEGALPGTVRGALLDARLAAERPLSEKDLGRAREAFLTSALLGAAPVTEVDGRRIGDGRPGPAWRRVRGAIASVS